MAHTWLYGESSTSGAEPADRPPSLAAPSSPRVRSHRRFRKRGAEYVSDSGMNRMSRWCKATMRPSPIVTGAGGGGRPRGRGPPRGRGRRPAEERAARRADGVAACRGAWARVTIDKFRPLAFENCVGHTDAGGGLRPDLRGRRLRLGGRRRRAGRRRAADVGEVRLRVRRRRRRASPRASPARGRNGP